MTTYVKTGTPGYGPDLSDDDSGADNVRDVCELIRWELDSLADMLHDDAQMSAEAGDYERAWKMRAKVDDLGTLAANLDYDQRATAPLYKDDTPKLDATMQRIIDETFPLDVSDNLRLYVWEA